MEWTNIDLLLKLVFSHILIDFVLQTNKIVQKKKEKNGFYHLIHSLSQAAVAYLIVGQWDDWMILPVIFITHWGIDYWKVSHKQQINTFIIDQALHYLVLLILWLSLTQQFAVASNEIRYLLACNRCWAVLIAFLLVLKPSSIFLALFTKRWRSDSVASESLQNAGQWIGYLERILILTFILAEQIEAIGFLLAAKSIFRFGELSKSKEIKTTEYVLIGTLASFTTAILLGLILNKLIL